MGMRPLAAVMRSYEPAARPVRPVRLTMTLLAAVAGSFVIQIIGIQVPFFQKFLQTVSLGLGEWLLILVACGWLIIIIEMAKYLFIVKRKNNLMSLARVK
jgi:magnesium-transporting ATPase (P-type)